MAEEPLPSGWLAPRPPSFPPQGRPPHAPPAAPAPARGQWPPPPPSAPSGPPPPSSPLAVTGIVAGAMSLVLLVLSAGLSFGFSIALSLIGFMLGRHVQRRLAAGAPGRPGQARAAVVLAAIGLILSGAAAVAWMILYANDITAQDLERLLQREAEELQRRR